MLSTADDIGLFPMQLANWFCNARPQYGISARRSHAQMHALIRRGACSIPKLLSKGTAFVRCHIVALCLGIALGHVADAHISKIIL